MSYPSDKVVHAPLMINHPLEHGDACIRRIGGSSNFDAILVQYFQSSFANAGGRWIFRSRNQSIEIGLDQLSVSLNG